MKLRSFSFSFLVIAVALVSNATALNGDEANNGSDPRFGDPSAQSNSRNVAQPGGAPYYQSTSSSPQAFSAFSVPSSPSN